MFFSDNSFMEIVIHMPGRSLSQSLLYSQGCARYHCLIPQQFYCRKKFCPQYSSLPSLSFLPAPGNPGLLSVSTEMALYDMWPCIWLF